MSQRNDEQIDVMLSSFFADRLDPQRGRAVRGFRRHIDETMRSAWRQRTWVIGAFVTGMAASLAMLWAGPLFRAASPGAGSAQTGEISQANPTSPASVPAVERVVQSHTTDEGILMLGDDTPVRVLRREKVEQTRRLDDQQKVREEPGVPQDELVFIKIPTY